MTSVASRLTQQYKRKEDELLRLQAGCKDLRVKIREAQREASELEAKALRAKQEADRTFEQFRRHEFNATAQGHDVVITQNRLLQETNAVERLQGLFDAEKAKTAALNDQIERCKEQIQELLALKDGLQAEIRELAEERASLTADRKVARERMTREEIANSRYEQSVLAMSSKIHV